MIRMFVKKEILEANVAIREAIKILAEISAGIEKEEESTTHLWSSNITTYDKERIATELEEAGYKVFDNPWYVKVYHG